MQTNTAHIWNDFSDKLRGFILKRVPNKDHAEDILQDVFIKIHTKIDTLTNDKKLTAWIYQIARNSIIDYYRSNKHATVNEETDFIEDDELNNESLVKLSEGLHEFMDELPNKYCDALCKTEFEGLSQVDYAKESGLSVSGAKSRVQRGRNMIKDMLMKCCHFQFDKYGTLIDYHPIKCCCCHQYFIDHPKEK